MNPLKSLRQLWRHTSLRIRLTSLFVLIFGGTLAVLGILTFRFLSDSLSKEFDDALYNYAIDVTESITLDSSGDLEVAIPQLDHQKIYPFFLGTALIQVRSIKGEIMVQDGNFGTFEIPYRREFSRIEQGEDVLFRTITELQGLPVREAEGYRVVNLAIDNSPIPQLVLQVAVPMTFLESQIANRKLVFELIIPLVILVSALAGYSLSFSALRPISEMISKAHGIEASNLSERLPMPLAKDELFQLSATMNEMLSRIEKSYRSQERFVSDASHQLLTPLTIIKGELESERKKNPAPWLLSLSQEVDQLIQLTRDLLLLAQADAGEANLQFSELFLEDVVVEAIARAEKLAKPKGIKISFNMTTERAEAVDRPRIKADEGLLLNAIFNIVENAVKYSPSDETVRVELFWREKVQVLSVQNKGPSLPQGQEEAIFERFSRANSERPGYGLGLAIAKKISDLHGARLWAQTGAGAPLNNAGALFFFEIKNI